MNNTIFAVTKKPLALILSLLLIIPTFIFSSFSVNDKTLTLDEAKNLIVDAIELSYYTFDSLEVMYTLKPDMNDTVVPEGFPQSDSRRYMRIKEDRMMGGSLSGMEEFAKSIYTDDMYLKMSSSATIVHSYSQNGVGKDYETPLFYRNEKGELYMYQTVYRQLFIVHDMETLSPESIIAKLNSTSSDEASVSVGCILGDNVANAWVECKFLKTKDGWRIADCDFTTAVSTLYIPQGLGEIFKPREDGTSSGAPNTADASFEQIVMLTVVATLSLVAVSVALSRRRRAV